MILVDANILIYAYDKRSPQHINARTWLSNVLVGHDTVAFSWIVMMAFIRTATNKKLFLKPYSTNEAFDVVKNWLSAPRSSIISPGREHLSITRQLAHEGGVYGADLTDAHIAALAIEHGASLATTDGDFQKFSGLRLINPLVQIEK